MFKLTNPMLKLFMNSGATKHREKSVSMFADLLLIIVTNSNCWQHPSTPRMITWPTIAYGMRTWKDSYLSRSPWHNIESHKETMTAEGEEFKQGKKKKVLSSIWFESSGAIVLSGKKQDTLFCSVRYRRVPFPNWVKVSLTFLPAWIKALWSGTAIFRNSSGQTA